MKRILKTLSKIVSYLILTLALILFIPPIILWVISQYFDDPTVVKDVIKEINGAIKPD